MATELVLLMKLGVATCGKIAKAMVGEEAPLPSRSIRTLEQFLHGHDIDDSYKNSDSKHRLACRAVNSVDTCSAGDNQLHATMIDIITSLGDKENYCDFQGNLDKIAQEKGVSYLNESLSKHGLEVQLDEERNATLCNAKEIPLTKGASAVTKKNKFVFLPRVVKPETQDLETDENLVSVMMPFAAGFNPVIEAIRESCESIELTCQRADDIWEETAIIDEIFALICRSGIVVCDLTGRNPNVLYEMGIAQTLGKPVVMLTQNNEDIPFDVKHHRYLKYLSNGEGLEAMKEALTERLETIWNQEFGEE